MVKFNNEEFLHRLLHLCCLNTFIHVYSYILFSDIRVFGSCVLVSIYKRWLYQDPLAFTFLVPQSITIHHLNLISLASNQIAFDQCKLSLNWSCHCVVDETLHSRPLSSTKLKLFYPKPIFSLSIKICWSSPPIAV